MNNAFILLRQRLCLSAAIFALPVMLLLASCQVRYTADPTARLAFSIDTLRFDTVFTEQTSITRQLRVYNPNRQALKINSITMQDGRFFRVNIDGEADTERLRNLTIEAGDSMFVFVKTIITGQTADMPVLLTDKILFNLNEHTEQVCLEAYGQNVVLMRKTVLRQDFTFTAQRPYLLLDTVIVAGKLTFDAGARLYMHDYAALFCLSDVTANGTREQPVRIQGDRLDDILTDVSYNYVSGKWNGIYLLPQADLMPVSIDLEYVDMICGSVGIYCLSEQTDNMPHLRLSNSRIHNFSAYGIVLQNTDAELINNEISNCASYCVYLAGGTHTLVHNTIASYFQSMNIQPVSRDDAAAVYINNLSKQMAPTNAYFYNNIITGNRTNNLVLATPLQNHYSGEFRGNYLRCDTLPLAVASDNRYYEQNDTVFRNISIRKSESGKGYDYYDFRLDSLSKARQIAIREYSDLYLASADRYGVQRDSLPDAGCYEWQPNGDFVKPD